MLRRRMLVAFDFDHTIVEENSDVVARKLIHVDLIPEDVRKLYQTRGWIDYMGEIFKLLHKHGVTREMIVTAMHNLAPTPHMLDLLKWLKAEGHETIIISDSNSVFIDEWLRRNNLTECVEAVFTNPASFGDDGLLSLKPYHDQDWCTLSTRNLCKGHILEAHIKARHNEGVEFEAVAYVGDGQNDFCPALKLSEIDFVFPRAGFSLETMVQEPEQRKLVFASVYSWTTATDIKNVIQNAS